MKNKKLGLKFEWMKTEMQLKYLKKKSMAIYKDTASRMRRKQSRWNFFRTDLPALQQQQGRKTVLGKNSMNEKEITKLRSKVSHHDVHSDYLSLQTLRNIVQWNLSFFWMCFKGLRSYFEENFENNLFFLYWFFLFREIKFVYFEYEQRNNPSNIKWIQTYILCIVLIY